MIMVKYKNVLRQGVYESRTNNTKLKWLEYAKFAEKEAKPAPPYPTPKGTRSEDSVLIYTRPA